MKTVYVIWREEYSYSNGDFEKHLDSIYETKADAERYLKGIDKNSRSKHEIEEFYDFYESNQMEV